MADLGRLQSRSVSDRHGFGITLRHVSGSSGPVYLRRYGKMFPKKGNYFPNRIRTEKAKVSYPLAIAAALRSELGGSHQAVKTVMRWTGANERTVKNWFAGRRGPRGEHLLSLIGHSNVVLELVLRLAGRDQIIAGKTLFDARNVLADMVAQIDSWMNGAGRPRSK
jgi:hypothetical protein